MTTTTTTERICIVHDRKVLSKFHGTINQLRRSNEFNLSALQQLPKRCCSCQNQTGESLFTIDHLREICQQIQSEQNLPPVKFPPVKPIHYITLEYPPLLTSLQRRYKAGRFIGRNGQNIRLLQQSLNIRIDILNANSSKTFRQIIQKLQAKSNEKHINDLWLLITMKNENENDNIEKVKQSLENTWKQIDVTTRKRRSPKSQSSTTMMTLPVDTSLDGDTRWKQRKQKKRGKYKTKENRTQEQEQIQPQPFVKPISMPKEIQKYRKTKGK